jgi:guanylate kinase
MEARIRENEKYLADHAEVKDIVKGFLAALLKDKPSNVFAFTKDHFSKLQPKDVKHAPLVIVGPSGVGKGTLITRLMNEFSTHFGFSVSHTTRNPREGEVHGVHYHFASHEEVRNGVSQGLFIEHAEVHGNIYGTSYTAVGQVQESGKICILDIDVQGMEAMKRTHLNPRTIFIAPPSHEELEKRLRGRGTESEENIQKRLANAHKELLHLSKDGAVHHTIVNDDLQEAYQKLRQKIVEWYPHLEVE